MGGSLGPCLSLLPSNDEREEGRDGKTATPRFALRLHPNGKTFAELIQESVAQSAGHSFSQRPDSARDHLSRPARTRGSALTRSSNTRRSEPPDGKSDCLDSRELCQASARGRPRTGGEHGRIHSPPSFPDAHRDEPATVSKTTEASIGAEPDAEQWSRCR